MKLDNIEFLDNKSNLIVGVISTRVAKSGAVVLDEEEEEEGTAPEDVPASEPNEPTE